MEDDEKENSLKHVFKDLKEYSKEEVTCNLTVNNFKFTQSTRIGNYIYYVPCIGKGSFSKVFIGHHINNKKLVAIKRINTSSIKKMSLKRLNSEISLLKNLDHENIVKFHEAFTDISNNIYIVTEYCNSGNLDLYTKKIKLDLNTIKKYMNGIKEGLKFLISNNVLHRDLKPQNILLHKEGEEVCIKIADFGFAKQYDILDEDSISSTLCGTPMYLSPELIKHKKYTLVSDLWSIGIIFYQLIHHTTPFKKPKNILELIHNIDTMKYKYKSELNGDIKDLLSKLLQTDPHRRINWDNFITHEYFSDEYPTGINNSLELPKGLQYEGVYSSDDEDDENQYPNNNSSSGGFNNISTNIAIPARNGVEKSFIQQTSKLYSEPFIVNDYLEFIPSSVPTEKTVFIKPTSSWTDSPVLKYITSSLTKITETFNLGGK